MRLKMDALVYSTIFTQTICAETINMPAVSLSIVYININMSIP